MPTQNTLTKALQLICLPILFAIFLAACDSKPADPPFSDVDWQWIEVADMPSNAPSKIPSPENYTLRFLRDGSVSVLAEGSRVSGSYTLSGNQLSIVLTPTLAFWGEKESLDLRFFGYLSQVEHFSLVKGLLILGLADDSGQMTFHTQN